MRHYQSGDATATGDTTKTSMGTITTPVSARRIVGVWAYACAAATMTSGEAVSGILELESPDVNLQPFQLPLDVVTCLTSGVTSLKPTVWAVDIPLTGGSCRITGYITCDAANTGALKGRFGLITE